MRRALVCAALAASGPARAEPLPVSPELIAEPVTPAWRQAPIQTRTMVEVTLGGALPGIAYTDEVRFHAGVRLGAGVVHLRNRERVLMVLAEAELGRDVGLRAGLRVNRFRYEPSAGFTAAIQSDGRDLGLAAGPCLLIVCVELHHTGLVTGEHVTALALTAYVPLLSLLEAARE